MLVVDVVVGGGGVFVLFVRGVVNVVGVCAQ